MRISRKLTALVVFLLVILISGYFLTANVSAVTRTWDGGGTTNDWSDCVNWSSNSCPGASDDVVFNGTSTKNATIDASFTGTVNSVSINSGYTGIITQSRSLTVSGSSGFTQNAGTYNGGAQTLTVGSFSLGGGSFTAPANLNVGISSFWAFSITAGTFTHNSGTITFQDQAGSINNCNSNTFNLIVFTADTIVSVNNANCTLPMGNNPTTVTALHVTAGILSGTGTITFTTTGGGNSTWFDGGNLSGFSGLVSDRQLRISTSNINLGTYTTVDLNDQIYGSFLFESGTFTAPSGTMTVAGGFTISGGTFNANGGTVEFDGSGFDTIDCNSATFNLVTFTHTNNYKTVSSNCSLPMGNNPSSSGSIVLNGTLSGTGTLNVNGTHSLYALRVNAGSALSGFSGLSTSGTGALWLVGATLNLGSYSTVVLNTHLGFVQQSGTFTAPSGTMSDAGWFEYDAGTFNANGGTIAFDGSTSDQWVTCSSGNIFNYLTFSHTGGITYLANCTFPVGANGSFNGTELYLNGNAIFSGSGTYAVNGLFVLTQTANDFSAFSTLQVNGEFRTFNQSSNFQSNSIDINGDFDFGVGSAGSSYSASTNFSVSGDINTRSCSFDASNSTVTLDGTNQAITSDIFNVLTFKDLIKNAASAQTLTITASDEIRITDSLVLNGMSGNLLSLRSDSPGTQWVIHPGTTRTVSYLDVQDSNNTHPVEIEMSGTNSVDSGNNIAWDFDSNPNLSAYNIYTVDPFLDQIRKVDAVYGTELSSTPITLSGFTVLSSNGLAYNPLNCTLYAIIKLQGQSGRELVTLNPTTGVATPVGNTGKNFAGIVFDNSGVLWGITGNAELNLPSSFYTLNTSNGASAFKVTLSNGDGNGGQTIGYNPINGLLYHLAGRSTRVFETVDPTTLTVTNIPMTFDYDYGEATAMMYSTVESKFLVAGFNTITRLTLGGTANSWIDAGGVNFNSIKGMVPETCSSGSAISNIPGGVDATDVGTGLDAKVQHGEFASTGRTIRLEVGGIRIADITVDLTTSRNWTGVNAGVDTSTGKSFVVNLAGAPGAASTHTLYIPMVAGVFADTVIICPSATSLNTVTSSCSGGVIFSEGDTKNVGSFSVTVSRQTISGTNYWIASGVGGTGGLSLTGQNLLEDILTRLQVSVASNHEIHFGTINGLTASGQTILITFDPAGQNWDLSTLTITDLEFFDDGVPKTLAALPGADIWGAVINTGADTITLTAPSSGTDYVAAGSDLLLKAGTNATGGVNQIVNPASVNSYEIHFLITNTGIETGEVEIPIIDDDTVNVTGYIDTFITFDIDTADTNVQCDAAGGTAPCDSYGGSTDNSGYVVDLGEMTTSTVNKSGSTVSHADGGSGAINNIWFDLSSNATGGSVVRSYSLNNDLQGPGGSTIPSVGAGEVQITSGSSLYGLQHLSGDVSSSVSGTLIIDADCDATSGSTYFCSVGGSPGRNIFSTTAAIDTARVQLRVGASPNSLNSTGTYTDQLTFIATATF